MSKCWLLRKTKKGELDYSFLELNWIVTLWNWVRFGDQNSVSGLQKDKELFRQKLSISFQFWDTEYSVIKTFDLTLKTSFSFYLHSFPGSLHIGFLVKRRPWEQSFSLWYWAKRTNTNTIPWLSAFLFSCSRSSCCQLLSINTWFSLCKQSVEFQEEN